MRYMHGCKKMHLLNSPPHERAETMGNAGAQGEGMTFDIDRSGEEEVAAETECG